MPAFAPIRCWMRESASSPRGPTATRAGTFSSRLPAISRTIHRPNARDGYVCPAEEHIHDLLKSARPGCPHAVLLFGRNALIDHCPASEDSSLQLLTAASGTQRHDSM